MALSIALSKKKVVFRRQGGPKLKKQRFHWEKQANL
jgi:hypothetical protein